MRENIFWEKYIKYTKIVNKYTKQSVAAGRFLGMYTKTGGKLSADGYFHNKPRKIIHKIDPKRLKIYGLEKNGEIAIIYIIMYKGERK